jgi:hypothetical protein
VGIQRFEEKAHETKTNVVSVSYLAGDVHDREQQQG